MKGKNARNEFSKEEERSNCWSGSMSSGILERGFDFVLLDVGDLEFYGFEFVVVLLLLVVVV